MAGIGIAQSAEPLYVLTDPVHLRQIVVNLLTNAIKYNRPNGSVLVEIQALPPEVILTIHDTRQGLSADHLSHL